LTLAEFSDVARRPRLRDRYGLDEAAVVDLEMALVAAGVHLDDPDAVPTSRDPRDDVFIALAVAANAEYLVTRDDDLKGDAGVRAALGEAGVQLVTVREFVAILEGEEVAPN
jgi:predicted nucleic acid-binding protein